MRRASGLRAFLGSGFLVRVLLPRQSATRTSSARVVILRLGLGSYRAKIQLGANRSLGRSPNRATAICGGYLWGGLIPCWGGGKHNPGERIVRGRAVRAAPLTRGGGVFPYQSRAS